MKAIIALSVILAIACAHDFSETSKVLQLTDQTFSRSTGVGTGSVVKPTLALLYAPWCGHCKRLIPTIDSLADSHDSSLIVAVNCDENKVICDAFQVRSYPTLVYITEDHKLVKYEQGRDLDSLLSFLNGGHKTAVKSEVKYVAQPIPLIEKLSEKAEEYIKLAGGPTPTVLALLTVASSLFVLVNLIFG